MERTEYSKYQHDSKNMYFYIKQAFKPCKTIITCTSIYGNNLTL